MANYHLETKIISRGKGHSFARSINYISGIQLHDVYLDVTFYHKRNDVIWSGTFLPIKAPSCFQDLQVLCIAIENAERRYDARTAREFIGSLPNELSPSEQIKIVSEFIDQNFVQQGLCAVAAIHKGENKNDPSKNNPHTHILVSTRTIGPDGFNEKKDREHNKKNYIGVWREQWAEIQNRAYERNGLDIRVSHESLEVQGKCCNREPTIHLSRIDWQKEHRGERTFFGDKKREIQARNEQRSHQRELEREYALEMDLSR